MRYAECLGRDSAQYGLAAPAPTPVAITASPAITAALVIDVFALFWPSHAACRISVPRSGIEPRPRQ